MSSEAKRFPEVSPPHNEGFDLLVLLRHAYLVDKDLCTRHVNPIRPEFDYAALDREHAYR